MASPVGNNITRLALNQITRGELLTKTLELLDENGQKMKISSPNFESRMAKLLIEKYDIHYDKLIPSSKASFDEFVTNFVIVVRRHNSNPKVDKNSKKIVKKFATYYETKIEYKDLHVRYSKRKSSELVPGTSRPINTESPLAKRIRLR